MPRPRKPPHYYRRPGRAGFYAYLDRSNRDISLETDDEIEAARKLAELLDRRRLRALAPNDRAVSKVFAEQLDRARTDHTDKTAYEAGLNGKRILNWLAAHDIQSSREIDKDTVEAYKRARTRGRCQACEDVDDPSCKFKKVSAARVNRELDTWKDAWRIAIEWGAAPPNALDWFAHLREPRPAPHQVGLTLKQIASFIKAEPDPGYRALFRTVVGSGIRDEESRHIQPSDIRTPWFRVTPQRAGSCDCHPEGWETKGFRYREIPISETTAKAARKFLAERHRLNLDPKAVWKRIQAARRRAKITIHFSMQDLRRAWASHMLRAGHRIEDISRWLGHRDVLTTMRYLRVVSGEAPRPDSLPL